MVFANDTRQLDREISIYSPEIAKAGAHTEADLAWRESLAVGNNIDCYDSTGWWYASTVTGLETQKVDGEDAPMIHIAFRMNHPDGDKTDAQGARFFGWEEAWDEWLPLYSARV